MMTSDFLNARRSQILVQIDFKQDVNESVRSDIILEVESFLKESDIISARDFSVKEMELEAKHLVTVVLGIVTG